MKKITVKKSKLRQLKYVLSVVGVVVVVFLAVFISARTVGNVSVSNITDGFRQLFSSSSTGGYPYKLESLNAKEIGHIGNDVFVLYNDSALVLTDSARIIGNVQLSSSSTRVKTCNGRALIYDTVKNTVVLMSKTEKLAETQAKGRILTAALGKNGSFAVAVNGEASRSELAVYNSRQKNVFDWECAGERIIDMSFSADCKKLAVLAVGAENAVVYSRLVVFDIGKTEPVADLTYSDAMMLRVCFTSSGRLIAVGDNEFTVYNRDYERIDGLEYSENSLCGVSFDERGNAVICISEYGGAQTELIRYSSSGEKTFQTTFKSELSQVYADGSRTAVLSGKEVTVLNSAGETVKSVELEELPDSIVFAGGSIYSLEQESIVKY